MAKQPESNAANNDRVAEIKARMVAAENRYKQAKEQRAAAEQVARTAAKEVETCKTELIQAAGLI